MIDPIAQAIAIIMIWHYGLLSANGTKPTECKTYEDIQYCYYQGESDKVLYFMHGYGDNERAWTDRDTYKKMDEIWRSKVIARPHIVSISRKVWWYVDSVQGEKLNAFSRWIENRFQIAPSKRILLGESMGGHNAFRWATDFPENFSRMALLCPAIPKMFYDPSKNSLALNPLESLSITLIKNYYEGAKKPIYQLPSDYRSTAPAVPHAFVFVTPQDAFGFYEGGIALEKALRTNSHTEFEEQKVQHCFPEPSRIADFLVAD